MITNHTFCSLSYSCPFLPLRARLVRSYFCCQYSLILHPGLSHAVLPVSFLTQCLPPGEHWTPLVHLTTTLPRRSPPWPPQSEFLTWFIKSCEIGTLFSSLRSHLTFWQPPPPSVLWFLGLLSITWSGKSSKLPPFIGTLYMPFFVLECSYTVLIGWSRKASLMKWDLNRVREQAMLLSGVRISQTETWHKSPKL